MINLYSLKYFYDSCRLMSMTEAAKLNHVSRPAISQAIKKLEAELDVALLDHKRRELKPTREGMDLMKKAALVFAEVDSIGSTLRNPTGKLRGVLTVGAVRSLVTSYLDKSIRTLRKSHPELEVRLKIENSEGLLRMLSDRKIDVALYLGDESLPGHTQVVIEEGYFQFVTPIRIRDQEAFFALTEKRPETERLKTLFERKYKKEIPIFCQVPSWDAIQSWLKRGVCGGLLPEFMLRATKTPCRVIFDKVWPYEIKIVYADSKKTDPLITEFVATL